MADAAGAETNGSDTSLATTFFGVDLGNSLAKIVYFDGETATNTAEDSSVASSRAIRDYLINSIYYDHFDAVREDHLTLRDVAIDRRKGTLHFIRFPVIEVDRLIPLIQTLRIPTKGITVVATGMGAYIHQAAIEATTDVDYHTADEFNTMIAGLAYLLKQQQQECYYLENPWHETEMKKVHVPNGEIVYPFLIVTVGSATSIQVVESPTKFTVVGGANIGGGTFLGLAYLLTPAKSFDEVIEMARRGNNKDTVDKILGEKGCQYYQDRFGVRLPDDFITVHFGHMLNAEKRSAATPENLARSLVCFITSIVGTALTSCLKGTDIKQVLFAGSFFRNNEIALRELSRGMAHHPGVKGYFLEHEGFCGAIGSLVGLLEKEN